VADAHFIFNLTEDLSAQTLNTWMPGDRWVEEKPEKRVRTYLDSFDWRLFKANTALELTQGKGSYRLTWRELGSGRVLDGRTATQIPRFASDCASPGLRERFTRLLGHRALMEQISVTSDTHSMRLLDDEGKTLLRIELRQDDILPVGLDSNVTLPTRVYLFPLRGFQASFDKTLGLLKTRARLEPAAEDPMLAALRTAGKAVGKYTNKPTYVFTPDTPTHEAARSILSSLVDVMLANVEGICKNLDTEFVHDFLLAVRRTRCILDRFPGTFEDRALNLIRQDITWLEEAVTETRDLDIYLALFKDYETRLPQNLRQALSPLSKFLDRQRVKTHQKARLALESPRFKTLIRNWQELLASEPPCVASHHLQSAGIAMAADRHIREQYRLVLEKSLAIEPESPINDLLDLHQRCKRLGYLLEIFRSLYPDKAYSAFMKELDGLQQNLNQFHDLDLQQRALHEAGIAMQQDQRILPVWLDAIELLVTDLTKERGRVRKAFIKQFARFSGKKVRKRFQALCREKNKPQEQGA
jgi:CHAD domain-containing protein